MIKLQLVDDHSIVRDGIRSTLKDQKDIRIVAEASNGREAIEMALKHHPDVIIMDITMPVMNGIEATLAIKKENPKSKILVLSMHENEDYILKAIEAGASGYLLKDTSKDEFVKAITKVASGEQYYGTSISNVLVNSYLQKMKVQDTQPLAGDNELTKRELEILKLIVEGQNNREIADKLDISIRTIETHRGNMMKKLKVKNAIEMVRVAMEEKLV